jgi:hypothetical protein
MMRTGSASIEEELPTPALGRKRVRTSDEIQQFHQVSRRLKPVFVTYIFRGSLTEGTRTPRLARYPSACRSLMERTSSVRERAPSVPGCNDEHEKRALREGRALRVDGHIKKPGRRTPLPSAWPDTPPGAPVPKMRTGA